MPSLDAAFDYIDRLADAVMSDMGLPGLCVAVTDRSGLLRTSAYGVADIASRAPVTPETVFEIGSLGKPFTVITLLQLQEAGQVDLSAPVARYLPWFEVQSSYPPITVHHLLNHTAGIPRGTDLAPYGLYESWALRYQKASAPPGTYFSYSNVGYKTLGFLVERVTGEPLSVVIQRRVLEPLGMEHTSPATTFETRGKTATGYASRYDDRPEHVSNGVAPAIWAEFATGDGAQTSTAADMATYVRMLLNRGLGPRGRIITEASFDLMTRNGVWTGGDYYGYGLATYSVGGRAYIGHGGGNSGFRSAMVLDMAAGLGTVLLTNRMGETDPMVEVAQQALVAVRAGVEGLEMPPLPPARSSTVIPNAVEYAGTYRSDDDALSLVAEEGKLVLQGGGTPTVLERRAPDRFHANHPGYQLGLIEFGRQQGKVVEAFYGGRWYVNEGYVGPREFAFPPEWRSYVGHYRSRSPELSNFRVVIRKGGLFLLVPWGYVEPLVPTGEGQFRIGSDARSPEVLRFDAIVDGRALRADYSGCPYYRTFTP